MSVDHHELEWQFDAANVKAVEQWLSAQPRDAGVTIGPESRWNLVDTYLDTDDWRFHRAGYALRVRRAGDRTELTLKALAPPTNGIKRRREVTEELAGDSTGASVVEQMKRAPGAVGQRVQAVAGRHVIIELFEVHTSRRTMSLQAGDTRAGELALDETTIHTGTGGTVVRLQRVEVESDGEPRDDLKAWVKRLRKCRACELTPARVSKYEAGLTALGRAPAGVPDLGRMKADSAKTVGELALATLRQHVTAMLDHEPGARLGDEPEQVHAMRVAIRRLRSVLNLFKDQLPARVVALRQELSWVNSMLAPVRDLDVQIEQVAGWLDNAKVAMNATDEERQAQMAVHTLLSEQRQAAHRLMVEALNSRRYEQLVTHLTRFLRQPGASSGAARAPVFAAIPKLLTRRYGKLRKIGDRVEEAWSAADAHALRIQCKRLRYSLECVAEQYGRPAKDLLAHTVTLLDTLGRYHDSQVAIDQLRRLSAEPAQAPQTIFALGQAAQRYEQEGAAAKQHFPKDYARIKGKPWKRLRNRIKRLRGSA